MKRNMYRHLGAVLAVGFIVASVGVLQAQTATWTGANATTDWNDPLNWDIGTPAEGTNALISAGVTVDYSAPMAATSFAMLSSAGVLNLSAGGFVVDGAGDGVIGIIGGAARLNLNPGATVQTPNGGLTLSNGAALLMASGSSLVVQGNLLLGRNATGNTGFLTNNGGTISAAATSVNPNNNASTSRLVIGGGTNDLGAVVVKRNAQAGTAFATLGTEGLIISNGLVRATSIDVGGSDGNSWLTMFQGNGVITNTGDTILRQATGGRASRFLQTGGLFVSTGINGVNLRGHNANNAIVIYAILGGTNLVEGFVLGNPAGTDTTGTVRLTNSAKIYIGSGGFSAAPGALNTKSIVLNSGGVFGAQANWSGTEPIILAGGSFDAGDLNGTPHDISISGVLSGGGALTKMGGGTLTLDGVNTYSGNTLVNQGTLALGASGSIPGSPQIVVASGATLDVSLAVGFTLGASRTLAGNGTVVGDVDVASGGIISPGTSPGTLTLANSLTQSGGAVNHFELPTTPGPGNDLLVVNGDLNISGLNTIEIVGGGSAGTVHTLIQYGGTFNGTVANFTVTGASGVLSNNATTKTISLIIQSSVRSPGNVVWVGNAVNNDWDTVNRTNWINTGTAQLDYFVSGDNALFNNSGTANPIVNIVGNNSPATVTVDATGNYTFSGAGAIAGTGGLIKSNTGTLTILTENTYTGPTVLGGGVLVANTLAVGGLSSSIGASSSSAANLVFGGGTLRYLGASQTIDRSATLNAGGGTLDVDAGGTTLMLSGALTGAGALHKAGAGGLTLTAASDYSGGTLVSAGTLRVNVPTAVGTNTITLAGGSLFLGLPSDTDIANPIAVTSPSGLIMGGSNNRVNGAVSGDAALNVTVNSGLVLTFNGDLNNYTGVFDLGTSAGVFRFNSGGGNTTLGCPNATINLGTANAVLQARNAGTMSVGALRGGPGTFVRGQGSGSGTLTWEVGGSTNEPSTTYEGTIEDAAVGRSAALRKIGAGVLTLTGNSTYTGPTTVTDGTLQVNGSLGATTVTVIGGTLAGTGTVNGPVDMQFGTTLAPGASIGTFTVNGFLSLGGDTVVEVNKGVGNDQIVVNGGVTFGGTLTVQNIGGALQVGDSFQIFSAGGSGDFTEIIGSPGAGMEWDFDPNTGLLSVVVPGVTLNYTQIGNDFQFSWSGNYVLQVQTNSLNVGLSDNWVDYPGGGSSPVTVTMDPNAPAVFFRLAESAPAALQ